MHLRRALGAVESPGKKMAEPLLGQAAGVHRPRNVDWKRAAALLYGDWGTSKAYVIGLAFVAAGFSSFPIILAVCALTAVVGFNYIIVCAISPTAAAFIPPRDNKAAFSPRPARFCWWQISSSRPR